MAINGYRTIPTDGSGELYSWSGCVVLVSHRWSDGPAFAERVVATDHDDAALAFRDLAGWLLARPGDEIPDFAAVLQTGSSLLCMAAGEAEVTLDGGRRVSADVSGMWAQLVLPERPDQIQLGISAGDAPARLDLGYGVVEAQGALLTIDGTDNFNASESRPAAEPTAASPEPVERQPGNIAADLPAVSDDAPQATDTASLSASSIPVPAPTGTAVGGVSRPGTSSMPQAVPDSVVPAAEPQVESSAPQLDQEGGGELDTTAAPDSEADVTGDPRGSPSGGAPESRHQLPFDAELDDGPATDADGLVGIVSEEPEPAGSSGSEPTNSARSDELAADRPEPTGEHLSASSFDDGPSFDERSDDDDGLEIDVRADAPKESESTGLVPIVTTPNVAGSDPRGSVAVEPDPKPSRTGGRSPRGRAAADNEASWPPPPAWANDEPSNQLADDHDDGQPATRDGDAAEDADVADDWSTDAGAYDEVGGADADLVTSTREHSAVGEPASGSGSGDDTNERDWDGDGLEDDTSIPLLLFDDGVAVELPGDVLIGRRPDPGVRDDPSRLHTLTMTDDSQAVSRNHVELRRRDDEVSIVDCGSANGTFVEATPGELTRLDAEAPHMLRDGERVVFGKRWFEYRAPRAPGAEA